MHCLLIAGACDSNDIRVNYFCIIKSTFSEITFQEIRLTLTENRNFQLKRNLSVSYLNNATLCIHLETQLGIDIARRCVLDETVIAKAI